MLALNQILNSKTYQNAYKDSSKVWKFLTNVHNSTSMKELKGYSAEIAVHFGFQQFSVRDVTQAIKDTYPVCFAWCSRQGVLEHYMEQAQFHGAFLWTMFSDLLLPVTWSIEEISPYSRTPLEYEMCADLIKQGITHGLSVPVVFPVSGRKFLVTGIGCEPAGGQAQCYLILLSRGICETIVTIQDHDVSFSLSPRVREALSLKAQGYPVKVIAARMGISFSTAVYHLQQAKRKLGSRDISQAVAKLVGGEGP